MFGHTSVRVFPFSGRAAAALRRIDRMHHKLLHADSPSVLLFHLIRRFYTIRSPQHRTCRPHERKERQRETKTHLRQQENHEDGLSIPRFNGG